MPPPATFLRPALAAYAPPPAPPSHSTAPRHRSTTTRPPHPRSPPTTPRTRRPNQRHPSPTKPNPLHSDETAHHLHPPRRTPLHHTRRQLNLQLNSLSRKRDLAGCLSLVERMRAIGVPPDHYSYSITLTCCARVRALDVALQVMDRMSAEGVQMDDHLCTNVLMVGARCEPPRLGLCARVFGLCGRPSRYMCNVMMDAYAREGLVEECRGMLRYMGVRGIGVDRYAVSALVKAYVNGGRVGDAVGALREMADAGLEVNAAAFGVVMHAFGKCGMVDEAVAVFDGMVVRGVAPTQVTYNILIGACVNTGFTERAFDVYHEMRETSPFRGDRYTLHLLMKGCLQDKQAARALQLYRAVRETRFQNNQVTWRLALVAAGMLVDLDVVCEVRAEMMERGVVPRRDTAATGVAAAVRCSDLELAVEMFGEWRAAQEGREGVSAFLEEVRMGLRSVDGGEGAAGGEADFEQMGVVVDEMERSVRREEEQDGDC